MGVQDTPGELLEAFEVRDLGRRKVPAGVDHVVELLAGQCVAVVVVGLHGKALAGLIESHLAHRIVEADVVAHSGFFDPALDVVPQHFTGRVRGDGATKMLFEGVVGELQALFRPVRPQVAVHAAVHRLAVFIQAGAPGVVPHATPIVLLLVTHQLGDLGALVTGRLEGSKLRHAARAGTDDCHA